MHITKAFLNQKVTNTTFSLNLFECHLLYSVHKEDLLFAIIAVLQHANGRCCFLLLSSILLLPPIQPRTMSHPNGPPPLFAPSHGDMSAAAQAAVANKAGVSLNLDDM